MSTAVIAALPRELGGLVRGWDRHVSGGVTVFRRAADGTVAACAGMGAARAALAVAAAMTGGEVERLLSMGLAGACAPRLRAGAVVRCGTVIDTRSGERYAGETGGEVLATTATIAGTAEKRRLAASYGAAIVDMEAAAVARLARGHGLRFAAIKAVSDEAGDELQGMNRFVTEDGRFRTAAFALRAAVRPQGWAAMVRLGRNSARALAALQAAVLAELAATEHERSSECR